MDDIHNSYAELSSSLRKGVSSQQLYYKWQRGCHDDELRRNYDIKQFQEACKKILIMKECRPNQYIITLFLDFYCMFGGACQHPYCWRIRHFTRIGICKNQILYNDITCKNDCSRVHVTAEKFVDLCINILLFASKEKKEIQHFTIKISQFLQLWHKFYSNKYDNIIQHQWLQYLMLCNCILISKYRFEPIWTVDRDQIRIVVTTDFICANVCRATGMIGQQCIHALYKPTTYPHCQGDYHPIQCKYIHLNHKIVHCDETCRDIEECDLAHVEYHKTKLVDIQFTPDEFSLHRRGKLISQERAGTNSLFSDETLSGCDSTCSKIDNPPMFHSNNQIQQQQKDVSLGPLYKFSLHRSESEYCHVVRLVNHINNHVPESLITVDHFQKTIFLHYRINGYKKWSMIFKNIFAEMNRPLCFMKPIQISIIRDTINDIIIQFIDVPLQVNHRYMIDWFNSLIAQNHSTLTNHMTLIYHDCRLIYHSKKGVKKWDTICFNVMINNNNNSQRFVTTGDLLEILRRGGYKNTTYPHEVTVNFFAGIGKNIQRFFKYDSTSTLIQYISELHLPPHELMDNKNRFDESNNENKENAIICVDQNNLNQTHTVINKEKSVINQYDSLEFDYSEQEDYCEEGYHHDHDHGKQQKLDNSKDEVVSDEESLFNEKCSKISSNGLNQPVLKSPTSYHTPTYDPLEYSSSSESESSGASAWNETPNGQSSSQKQHLAIVQPKPNKDSSKVVSVGLNSYHAAPIQVVDTMQHETNQPIVQSKPNEGSSKVVSVGLNSHHAAPIQVVDTMQYKPNQQRDLQTQMILLQQKMVQFDQKYQDQQQQIQEFEQLKQQHKDQQQQIQELKQLQQQHMIQEKKYKQQLKYCKAICIQ